MLLIVQYFTTRCNFCLSPAGDHLMSEIKTVGSIIFSLVSIIVRHVIHINALSFFNLAKLILPLRSLGLLSSCSAFWSMQICWCIPGACSSQWLGQPTCQRAAVPCYELSPSPEPLLLVRETPWEGTALFPYLDLFCIIFPVHPCPTFFPLPSRRPGLHCTVTSTTNRKDYVQQTLDI